MMLMTKTETHTVPGDALAEAGTTPCAPSSFTPSSVQCIASLNPSLVPFPLLFPPLPFASFYPLV